MADHGSFSLQDYCAWEEITFTWARALDTKDWDLLRSILAPKILLDYSEVTGFKDDNMTPEAYLATVNGPEMLGKRNVKTQHLLVGSKIRMLSSDTATAWRQIRVAHVVFDLDTKEQTTTAHGHGALQFYYQRVDGEWKLSGLKPYSDFFEGNIKSVFPNFPDAEVKF